tara:strand:- start:85857 stop:86216 length:360 start_codon:yes stop_codon:yes gene_type:complete
MKKLVTRTFVLAVGFLGLSAMADDAKAPVASAATPAVQAAPAATPAPVAAAPATAPQVQANGPAKTEKTEHNFEDLLVQGKYHFSDEAVTTVEEDKVLDSLLGIRTDFKDKIEQSAGRY